MGSVTQVLVVDLAARGARVEQVELHDTLGLGGKVLGIQLLERYLDPQVAPLAPENILVFTPSSIAAFGMSGSNRFGAFTKSPLTGIWLESYCGGGFARVFGETGWGAVVVSGAAQAPVHIHVTTEGAEIRSAAGLWGQDTFVTEARLLADLDKRSAVLSIGVGGENLVKVASVMHEQAHTLGRGGMGAVFGSKMIKALSVTSQGPLKPKVSEQFMTTRREVARLATEAPVSVNYRRFGTPMMVSIVNEAGAFPTDFFTRGVVEHRGTLEAETWPSWAKVETEGCPPCPIRCRKRLTLLEGPDAGRRIHGPEYETIYAFGGSCMVKHARDVARLNERCNLLGLDTISTANLMGLAVKGGELGLLENVPASGDVEAFDELLGQVACRSTSIGDALAEGLDSAAQRFGMSGWNITSKGLDPAGYEPRRLKSMALSYALSARGACHLRATFYKAEFGGLLEGLDDEAYVETYVDWEDRMLLLDSLTMCRFYRDFMGWDSLVSAATELNGSPVTRRQLEILSNDATRRIRRFNLACGITPDEDTVAERFFLEPTDKSSSTR